MAEKSDKKAEKKKGEGKGGGKAGKPAAEKADAGGAGHKVARNGRKPRLLTHYLEVVRPRMSQRFGYTNPHQVPKVEKVVVNCGIGEAGKNQKLLESVVDELGKITGQKAMVTRARKSIANFGLREGMPVGVTVTLRRAHMYEFLDRLVSVAIPRVRDFRGLSTRSFDGRGNYTMGVKEQIIFPEIDYDKVSKIHGLDITVVTSTAKDDEAFALLREMGFPFRGDEQPVIVGQPAA
jgi:large subunit ribosomal protein L5